LYHGEKESESGFIKSAIEIAEDGQAIYEFLQNAVDANASEFFIFYTQDYFLAINNGDKFTEDGVKSILNISQSTKENSSSTIGKFGIGFKLVHRLVGKNNGLEEIEKYNGPVLFSWDNNYLSNFLKNEMGEIDKHWLFKILYTNFPCEVNEKVKGVNYEEIQPFTQNELNNMVNFIKSSLNKPSIDINTLAQGSLFFLKLGEGKNELLKKEENTLKNGISYSINIIHAVQKNSKIDKIIINDIEVLHNKSMATISGEGYVSLYPKSIDEALTFSKKSEQEKISFFKYFPMESQKNRLNFMLHSEKFDIQANRRELHETLNNKDLFNKIYTALENEFKKIKQCNKEFYRIILVNFYLSDLENAGGSKFIQENLTKHLLTYIKKNIPTADSEFVSDSYNVKIIRSKLDVKLKKYKKFFNFQQEKVIKNAKSKLGLKEWNIIDALRYDNIEDWVKTLSPSDYLEFFKEINSAENLNNESIKAISDKKIFGFGNDVFKSIKEIDNSNQFFYKGFLKRETEEVLTENFGFNFTQINLSELKNLDDLLQKPKINPSYFSSEYEESSVLLILGIFKEYEIKNFAVVSKENDKYEINANGRHIFIKDKKFKDFLESLNIFQYKQQLIPDVFEGIIQSFLNLHPSDEDIKYKLIEKNVDFHNLIIFIETSDLKTEFLNKIQSVHFDTKNKYDCKSYEHKILKIAIAINYNIKEKILIDGRKIDVSLKREKITFKYGRANNEKTRSSNAENSDFVDKVIKFIDDKLEEEVKQLFKIEEEDKENAYEFLKQQRRDNIINTFQRLKFVVHYSLEKNKNLFIEFSDTKIIKRNTNEDESFSCLYSILTNKLNKPLDEIPEIAVLKINTIFKTALAESYYIAGSESAIEKEKLPQNFKPEYIPIFEKIGLVIDARLKDIRQRILKNESISSDDLKDFTQEKIINTLEFLSIVFSPKIDIIYN